MYNKSERKRQQFKHGKRICENSKLNCIPEKQWLCTLFEILELIYENYKHAVISK